MKCAACNRSNGTSTFKNNGKYYHRQCARCKVCNALFYEKPWCIQYHDNLYCDTPCVRVDCGSIGVQCAICCISFCGDDTVRVLNKRFYHVDCLTCSVCKTVLKTGVRCKIDEEGRSLLCPTHMDPKTEKKKPKFARTKINPTQHKILNHYFVRMKYPNHLMKDRISSETDLDLRVIKIWFQNRRARR